MKIHPYLAWKFHFSVKAEIKKKKSHSTSGAAPPKKVVIIIKLSTFLTNPEYTGDK